MGNGCCKNSEEGRTKRTKKKGKNGDLADGVLYTIPTGLKPKQDYTDDATWTLDEEARAEEEEMQILRSWLKEDLDLFIINNSLMSVQFFENFDIEIDELQKKAVMEDKEIGSTRLTHFQADKLMEQVGNHVTYRPRHGPLKNTETLLTPLQSYFIYQNVVVQAAGDTDTDSPSQEPPFYRLYAEKVENFQLSEAGYVNLKMIEIKPKEAIYESIGSPISPGSPSSSNTGTPRHSYGSPLIVRRTTTDMLEGAAKTLLQVPSQEITPYYAIKKLTEPLYIEHVRWRNHITTCCDIPDNLFTVVKKPIVLTGRRTHQNGVLETSNKYLNSALFPRHFLDVIAERLAEPLKLQQGMVTAHVRGDRVMVNEGKMGHRITPVLQSSWPDANFSFETRRTRGENALWPRPHMIKSIQNTGTYITPLGYLDPKKPNDQFALQWRYVTPRADEYFLLHTLHSHVRCYLFTLAIFVSFLKSENPILGLDYPHILHLLFSEIAKDFTHWPEERPAETLLQFLNTLSAALDDRKIMHFFLRRNLLESTIDVYLNKSKAMLNRIIENPLPYILLSLKNLRMRPSFYPELDWSRINMLATEKNIMVAIHPNLEPQKRNNSIPEINLNEFDESKKREVDDESYWRQANYEQIKKKKAAQIEEKRASVETINLDSKTVIDSNDQVAERERRRELLQVFISHFIKMGEKSAEFQVMNQAHQYLLQAKRLTILLKELEEDVTQLNKEIQKAEEKIKKNNRISQSSDGKKIESRGQFRLSTLSRDLPEVPTP